MIEDPHIDLGHLMIAIAEPHPEGLERYHRWFEREHMYQAVLVGPGAFAAERFVATRALKALRFPAEGGVFRRADLGSFVALYYLARDQDDAHFAWSYAQSERLTEEGRTNRDRELVLTWLCDYRARVARDADSVPEEIALDHRYAGLAMVWIEATGVRALQQGVSETSAVDALADWLVRESLPALLADSPIDQVLLFEPRDFPEPPGDVAITPGSIEPNPWTGRGLLLLGFFDEAVDVRWADRMIPFSEHVGASGLGEVRLAAPFFPADRGTRKYLDEVG